MTLLEIRIPQLGEGLQEARIVRFLKNPGDPICRDEPIYEMETDKAVMEIEAPAAGILSKWSAKEDEVLPIGSVVGFMESAESIATHSETPMMEINAAAHSQTQEETVTLNASGWQITNAIVSPRVREYAVSKGLTTNDLKYLAESKGASVTNADIDAFAAKPEQSKPTNTTTKPIACDDIAIAPRQKTLNFRLARSRQLVIPATMEMNIDWYGLERARATLKSKMGSTAPSQFILFAWCVAQTTRSHPTFRSALINDDTIRCYHHLQLGIAVARSGDELLLARIDDADALAFDDFCRIGRENIELTRNGEDRASDQIQLSITSMARVGITSGIPVVVAPSVGTIFIGAPFDEPYQTSERSIGFRRIAKMVFTFDHRIANGVGAARFMSDIRTAVEQIESAIR